jgi:hypothetical protein
VKNARPALKRKIKTVPLPLWHIIVYADENDDTVVAEHEDVPNSDLLQLLNSIREEMRAATYNEELNEQYDSKNEISITPVFNAEDIE